MYVYVPGRGKMPDERKNKRKNLKIAVISESLRNLELLLVSNDRNRYNRSAARFRLLTILGVTTRVTTKKRRKNKRDFPILFEVSHAKRCWDLFRDLHLERKSASLWSRKFHLSIIDRWQIQDKFFGLELILENETRLRVLFHATRRTQRRYL
jgi:hypothetical protein